MANKVNIGNLVVTSAYEKTFSTGSKGWFGKVFDPTTGKTYQITGAVEIGSKPKTKN